MTEYDAKDDGEKSYYAAIEAKRARQERVRKLFDYNAETGALTWKKRERSDFVSLRGEKIWNARYCGKEAGNLRRDGYRLVRVGADRHLAHRVVWLWVHGRFPTFVDHINGDPSDNRLANLREVTVAENGQNMRRNSRNKSGVIGVCWNDRDQRWRAAITAHGRRHHLGVFIDLAEAVKARADAERKHGFHPNHGRAA